MTGGGGGGRKKEKREEAFQFKENSSDVRGWHLKPVITWMSVVESTLLRLAIGNLRTNRNLPSERGKNPSEYLFFPFHHLMPQA